jgi:type I restriction enzyme S subunit
MNKQHTLQPNTDATTTVVPKLRFPEFRDAEGWEEGSVADIATVLQGYGFPEKHQGLKYGDYPFYKVSDISRSLAAGQVYIEKSANYINESLLTELRAKLIPVGTTIFAKIGEAIRSNKRVVTTVPCLIDNNAAGLKAIPGKTIDFFIFLLMEQISLIKHSGGVVPAVNKSAIEAIVVQYPSLAEQQRIADCLSSLDALIAAQARKVDALKTHKKGLMQQLFPRDGETQPRLRFPEFQDAGEWEKKNLADACTMQAGKFVPASGIHERFEDGMFPCYGGNGLRGFTATHTHDGFYPLIGRQGALCGNIKLANGKFHATEHAVVATNTRGINVVWLYYMLDLLELNRFATGQAQPGLSVDVLEKIPVLIPPTLPEQQRIADCLSSLDAVITAATQRLAALKTHKQGLMQQLFPAPEDATV